MRGATLCADPGLKCQKLRAHCDFYHAQLQPSAGMGLKRQKLREKCDFGVPGTDPQLSRRKDLPFKLRQEQEDYSIAPSRFAF